MNSVLEQSDWDPLIDLLRDEVKQYGGLYNLLDRQQKEIFGRSPNSVVELNGEIERYLSGMGEVRDRREQKVQEMADLCGCDHSLSLLKMLPYFPDFIHPLLEALIDEVNHMVTRTRKKARQNFMLLSRTMQITEEALSALKPESYSKVYSRKGRANLGGQLPSTYKALV